MNKQHSSSTFSAVTVSTKRCVVRNLDLSVLNIGFQPRLGYSHKRLEKTLLLENIIRNKGELPSRVTGSMRGNYIYIIQLLNSYYSRPPPPPNTADLGTDKKRRYLEISGIGGGGGGGR